MAYSTPKQYPEFLSMVIFTTQIFGTGKRILPGLEKTKQSPEKSYFRALKLFDCVSKRRL
jgi:hypothetical protein